MDVWSAAQTPKVNGGRGRGKNSNGKTPHGIKKLRELMLELAVSGKLVPQDAEDEPASVLLEKIAKEKERLIKEGKIKKQKKFPEISEDEKPFELPEGWEWVRFTDCYDVRDGTHDSPKKQLKGFPLVTSKNLYSGFLDLTNVSFISEEDHLKIIERSKVDRDDILFAMIGSIGNPVIVDTDVEFSIKNVALFKYYSRELSVPQYLRMFLEIAAVAMRKNASGGVQSFVSLAKLRSYVIAFPPLAEQHRIVAKVDELMVLCDQLEQQQTDSNATHQTLVETLLTALTTAAGQAEFGDAWQRIANHFDSLFTTEQSIDQLKQTILQLAVMGKLVPQDPNDLPAPRQGTWFVYALECEDGSIYIGQAEDVLERWKQHSTGRGAEWTRKHPPVRLVHWEDFNSLESAVKREKELKTGFGRKWLKRELAAGRTRQAGEPASVLLEKIAKEKERLIEKGKIKKQKPLPAISEDEKLFELPEGWVWVRWDSIAMKIGDIDHKMPEQVNEGFPYVSPRDFLPNNKIDLQGAKKISKEDFLRLAIKIQPQKGDIIYPRYGTIGENRLVETERDFLASYSCCVIKTMHGFIEPKYQFMFSLSMLAKHQAKHAENKTTQANVGIKSIQNYLMPLPPQAEQHRIVTKVDELMVKCETLIARLNDAKATQVQLADAIVEQAVV